MGILNIRNLPDDVHSRLRVRAAEAGRSMEAEARQIITDAVVVRSDHTAPAELQLFVDDLYGDRKPKGVADELIAERRRQARNE